MDLKLVISELRAELDSIDRVMIAMQRLAELRGRRTTILKTDEAEQPVLRGRPRKSSKTKQVVTASTVASGE